MAAGLSSRVLQSALSDFSWLSEVRVLQEMEEFSHAQSPWKWQATTEFLGQHI